MTLPRWLEAGQSHSVDGKVYTQLRIKTWHPALWLELWRGLDLPVWQKLYRWPRSVWRCINAPRNQVDA